MLNKIKALYRDDPPFFWFAVICGAWSVVVFGAVLIAAHKW